MTLYAIFEPKPGKAAAPAAIPEKFSWLAAILPPLFALVHGLWLELAAYVVIIVALGFAAAWIGGGAATWLYLIFALWIGFAAASIRRHALAWRGWRHRRDVVAADPDLARLNWLEHSR
jgi:membrane protein implicated in regulation of membrane protease activity